jgi:hypothetical protein
LSLRLLPPRDGTFALLSLYHAPIFAWLLLVSRWARQVTAQGRNADYAWKWPQMKVPDWQTIRSQSCKKMDYLFGLAAKLSRDIDIPWTQTVTMLS